MNTEAIIFIAEAFNDARKQAATEEQRRVYGHAAAGLEECLALLTPTADAASVAYAHILAGETVRSAIGAAPAPKN